jgi:hypothetical protein
MKVRNPFSVSREMPRAITTTRKRAAPARANRAADDATIDWLLAGDPAIRWQTLQDIVGARATTIERERKKVASDGWGARLLAEQGEDGMWAGRPPTTRCSRSATSAFPRPIDSAGAVAS